MQVRALLFDIGGTVFDWNAPVIAALGRHDVFADLDAAAFALACRAHFLQAADAAARDCGYRTAYVMPRIADPGEDYDDRGFAAEFDVVAKDFRDLAAKMERC